MKFGIREICDVVLRAKSTQKIGNKIFYKNEPVCYFDTLKTSTLEGAATTVYAQGGRGNARLMSWDGERTVTFTMEDALISPIGLSILTGAGLTEASTSTTIKQHVNEVISKQNDSFYVSQKPYELDNEPTIYVMALNDNGEVVSEPYLFYRDNSQTEGNIDEYGYKILLAEGKTFNKRIYEGKTNEKIISLSDANTVLVDYYTEVHNNGFEVNISPDKFGGTFYLEASTLWRDQATGKDLPAEFIIPSCRIQSNFSFSMSASGDPSTFTFTIDAFPDYTRWNKTQKVLADIQIIGASLTAVAEEERPSTWTTDRMNNDKLVTTTNDKYYNALVITDLDRSYNNIILKIKDTNVFGENQLTEPDYYINFILKNNKNNSTYTGFFDNLTSGATLANSSFGSYGAWTIDLGTILTGTDMLSEDAWYDISFYCRNKSSAGLQSTSTKVRIPIFNARYLRLSATAIKNPVIQSITAPDSAQDAASGAKKWVITLTNNKNNILQAYNANATTYKTNILDQIKALTNATPKTIESYNFYCNSNDAKIPTLTQQDIGNGYTTDKLTITVDKIDTTIYEKMTVPYITDIALYVRIVKNSDYKWYRIDKQRYNYNNDDALDISDNKLTVNSTILPKVDSTHSYLIGILYYHNNSIIGQRYFTLEYDSNEIKLYEVTTLTGKIGSGTVVDSKDAGYNFVQANTVEAANKSVTSLTIGTTAVD